MIPIGPGRRQAAVLSALDAQAIRAPTRQIRLDSADFPTSSRQTRPGIEKIRVSPGYIRLSPRDGITSVAGGTRASRDLQGSLANRCAAIGRSVTSGQLE
jgi:hypothetical protein